MVMFSDIAKGMSSRRANIGLSSEADIIKALDIMIEGKPRTNSIAITTPLHGPLITVQQLLVDFDRITADLESVKAFFAQICSFRHFLLASICCVVLHKNSDEASLKMVNEIMRRKITNASDKSLARLRKGALWVNTLMAKLAADGFGHLAYEIFVLWGRSISQYGDFADSWDKTLEFFKEQCPKLEPQVEIQSSLPYWVPFIIKGIVGELYDIHLICEALNYGQDPRISKFPRYLEYYHFGQVPLPQCSPADQNRKHGKRQNDGTLRSWSKRPRIGTAPSESNTSPNSGTVGSDGMSAADYIAGSDQHIDVYRNSALSNDSSPVLTDEIIQPLTGESEVVSSQSVLMEIGCTGGRALAGATQPRLAEGVTMRFANEPGGEQTKERLAPVNNGAPKGPPYRMSDFMIVTSPFIHGTYG
ncbi:hypothetical protein ACLOAV_004585 [Pseudogymnoascus australis]